MTTLMLAPPHLFLPYAGRNLDNNINETVDDFDDDDASSDGTPNLDGTFQSQDRFVIGGSCSRYSGTEMSPKSMSTSTAHPFLAYAKPTLAASLSQHSGQQKQHNRQQYQCNKPMQNHYLLTNYNSSNGHPNTISTNHEQHQLQQQHRSCAVGSTSSSQRRSQELLLERQLVDFELRCMDSFQNDEGVASHQAMIAASAVTKAAQQLASQSHFDHSTLFGHYLSAIEQEPTLSFSCHSNKDLFIQKQQQEIQFLRAAITQLITHLPHEQPNVSSCPQLNQMQTAPQELAISRPSPTLQTANEPLLQVPQTLAFKTSKISNSKSNQNKNNKQSAAASPRGLFIPKLSQYIPHTTTSSTTTPSSISPQVLQSGTPQGDPTTPRYTELMNILVRYGASGNYSSDASSSYQSPKFNVQIDRAKGLFVQLRIHGILIGGKYNGAVRNGRPNGNGVLRFDNRDLYIGEFVNGEMCGQGTLFCRKNNQLLVLRGEFARNDFLRPACSEDTSSAGAA